MEKYGFILIEFQAPKGAIESSQELELSDKYEEIREEIQKLLDKKLLNCDMVAKVVERH